MANHAYVITEIRQEPKTVYEDTFEIVKQKFPEFSLEYHVLDQRWCLSYKGSDYIGIEFWLSEYDGKPCIEFRHGHMEHHFLWWVEHEIREALAARYNAKVVDDALPDVYEDPRLDRYSTYRDYLVRNRWNEVNTIQGWKAYLNERLGRERDAIPDEIKHLIGEDIP